MDSAVVITARAPRDSETVRALRASGWRVTTRPLRTEAAEVAAESPALVVVEVPSQRPVRSLLEPFDDTPGLEEVPVVAVVDGEQLQAAARLTALADFVVRPLRTGELPARARRLVASEARDDDDCIRVDGLTIDLEGHEIVVDGSVVDLTYQEFRLLRFLASNPGRAFHREQLLDRVWGHDFLGGTRTVDIHVRRIRAKLGPPYAGYLQTVRHVGYKWSPEPASAAQPARREGGGETGSRGRSGE